MKYALLLGLFLLQFTVFSQSFDEKPNSEKPNAKMLLTIFLKHDQSMNLYEIEKIRNDQKFYERFPPEFTSEIYPTYNLYPIIGYILKNKSKVNY